MNKSKTCWKEIARTPEAVAQYIAEVVREKKKQAIREQLQSRLN